MTELGFVWMGRQYGEVGCDGAAVWADPTMWCSKGIRWIGHDRLGAAGEAETHIDFLWTWPWRTTISTLQTTPNSSSAVRGPDRHHVSSTHGPRGVGCHRSSQVSLSILKWLHSSFPRLTLTI